MRASRLPSMCLIATLAVLSALGSQSDGSKQAAYPPAMSMDYNPLLWQGEDAQFATYALKRSHCLAEASETAAAKSQNRAIQDLAIVVAQEQSKLYKKLHSMARTVRYPLPQKEELENCPESSRLAELTATEVDTNYLALMSRSASENVRQFEMEAARPQDTSNASLSKFVRKSLPLMRKEQAMVESTQARVRQEK